MQGTDQPDRDAVLDHAVDALYAVAPEDFVAARTARVKELRADGLREVAKEVAALRRPSVAAAAVNATVRADDPVVARLQDLGARLRHAQSALDAAALSALRRERDEVLAAWVAAARQRAGGLTSAVEAEVRDTAVAALADAAASEVVTSGSLTRALSYSGFGEVDVADAVARTSTGVVLTRIEGGRGEEAPSQDEEPMEDEEVDPAGDDAFDDLERDLDAAEKVVAAARAARRKALEADAAAQEALTEASSRVEQAEQLLRGAQEETERAGVVAKEAARALEAAQVELRRSRRERNAARAALEEAQDR